VSKSGNSYRETSTQHLHLISRNDKRTRSQLPVAHLKRESRDRRLRGQQSEESTLPETHILRRSRYPTVSQFRARLFQRELSLLLLVAPNLLLRRQFPTDAGHHHLRERRRPGQAEERRRSRIPHPKSVLLLWRLLQVQMVLRPRLQLSPRILRKLYVVIHQCTLLYH
jgi:hypothetical protein